MENTLTSQNIEPIIDPLLSSEDKSILITSERRGKPHSEEIETTKDAMLGKFKDSGELLSAYNNLEKEFTKRSQKLKYLESEATKAKTEQFNVINETIKRMVDVNPELGEIIELSKQLEVPEGESAPLTFERVALALKGKIVPNGQDAKQSYVDRIIDGDSCLKESILSKALDKLPSLASPKLNKYRGQTIITPPNRPQNIAEAGKLAENILNNRSR